MDKLFDLTFFTNDEDYEEGFHIGLFTRKKKQNLLQSVIRRKYLDLRTTTAYPECLRFLSSVGQIKPSRSTASWDGIIMRTWMKSIFLSAVALQTGMKRKKHCYWQNKGRHVKNGC